MATILAVCVAGCGWHPVYRSTAPGSPAAELSRIAVGPMPERSGQLLRLALQDRLGRSSAGESARYDITVSLAIRSETIAIRTDNTATRLRLVATADWKLAAQDAQHSTLSTGFARDIDGLDIVNEQYFALDLNSEAVQRRMTEAVADQIVQQVAAYFDTHPSPG